MGLASATGVLSYAFSGWRFRLVAIAIAIALLVILMVIGLF